MDREQLKHYLEYNAGTGVFTRKITTSSNALAGSVAGSKDRLGYIIIRICGKSYKAHRLAWLYINGAMPVKHLDHINGNPSDNRIANLRECLPSENQQNAKRRTDNASGYAGVSFHKASQKWMASIRLNKKTKHVGVFETPIEAHEAYLEAKKELHKFNPTVRKEPE